MPLGEKFKKFAKAFYESFILVSIGSGKIFNNILIPMNFGLIPIYSFLFSKNFILLFDIPPQELIRIYKSLFITNFILLAAMFLITGFTDIISKLTSLGTLFSVSLTFILVYATFSLLAFTYCLVLDKDNEDDYKKSEIIKKSGELFLISTCVVVIGLSFIYAFKILVQLFPNLHIFPENLSIALSFIYFFIALVLLLYSVIYFLFGLYFILKAIIKNLIV